MNYGIQVVNVPSAINIRKVRCVAFFSAKPKDMCIQKQWKEKYYCLSSSLLDNR